MTDYLSVEEAKGLRGLRLVLTAGVPGPWGEAAKGIFHAKDVAFVPVRQEAAQANEALVEWIGHANAPVAVYENEPGRAAWTEIIWLGERLAPTPSLVPADPAERAAMFGLIHAIAGEQGLGWSRRLMMLDTALSLPLDDDHPVKQQVRTLAGRYGHTPESAAGAATRSAGILQLLSKQLADQRAAEGERGDERVARRRRRERGSIQPAKDEERGLSTFHRETAAFRNSTISASFSKSRIS